MLSYTDIGTSYWKAAADVCLLRKMINGGFHNPKCWRVAGTLVPWIVLSSFFWHENVYIT